MSGERKPRSLRRKVLLGTAVWVGLILLAEAGVRVREKILYGTFSRAGSTLYAPTKEGLVLLKPNQKIEGASWSATTSSLGFRGKDPAIPKHRGTFRIVCIGGSTTFDTLAKNDEETWPARLEALLRAKHPSVEVVNAGVAGHTLGTSLGPEVWPKVESLEPDLVISYHAANEISGLAKQTFAPQAFYERREQSSALKVITDWSLLAYKTWLVADALMKPPEKQGTNTLPPSGQADFEKNLAELARRTKAKNVKLALGTFALRWRADQTPEVKEKLAQGAASVFPGLSLAGIEQAFASYNACVARAARAGGAILVPVSEELSGHEEYFGDCMHFTAEGSKRMSETMARALEFSNAIGE